MRAIGLMGNTMVMLLRPGLEAAGTGANTGKGSGMGLECTASTPATCMPGSGQTDRAMDVGCIHVRMAADSSGNSNGK